MGRSYVRCLRRRDLPRLAALLTLVSVSFSGLVGVALAAVPGTQLWAARYNGPGNRVDTASSVAVSPDGTRVFVTGSSVGSTSASDYATFAYIGSTGARVWAARYDGPGSGEDTASSVAVSPDGTKVFVTGNSVGDYATVAYSASTGVQLWATRYDGLGEGADTARSIAVSPDGTKVFVTGNSAGSILAGQDYDFDYATLAYNASSGAQLWAKRYSGPGPDNGGNVVAVSPTGAKVFVTGSSSSQSSATDYGTFAYNASTGAELWIKRFDGPGHFYDVPSSMVVNPAGTKVFVTGFVWGSSENEDYGTVAYAT